MKERNPIRDAVKLALSAGFAATFATAPLAFAQSDDVAEQTHQTFRNINAALAEAGATLADVVRVRVFVDQRGDFEVVAPILGEYFGDIRPANTTAIAPLVDARMKVEIEVTARKRDGV